MSKKTERPWRRKNFGKKDEIFVCFRLEWERKDLHAVYNEGAYPCDMKARDAVLKILAANGYEIVATGEGRYATAWIKKKEGA